MKKYVCDFCGYIYDPAVGDPEHGVAPGTAFEDVPDSWLCPWCGVDKKSFSFTGEEELAQQLEDANKKVTEN